ncbi:LOG family protein YgdH [Halieaceae bacterium IMCC14734]|uniref:AMP nucleosidase n=1 Tax=Candidatus Litorirhabdus singularis TaxID=2518993 RepID=A0ABT3TKQ2_9GAMM|nr:nucleotide 5'-monophosphate nucleosidase PpnN [Candidatus Litorirhabdus singularis]MCX2982899.1 LOG family protein YgdH [Candidatus Litorirhabdus singularis]
MKTISHVIVNPLKSLNLLSQSDMDGLTTSRGELFAVFRHCALAILNTDGEKDVYKKTEDDYEDFDIQLIPQSRGLRIELFNAPPQSFVDGKMIRGIQEHLFSALRDIVYTDFKITGTQTQPTSSADTTNTVFRILRNAQVVRPNEPPSMVVCWGGHSIPRDEYDYAKDVGYELGLRGLNIVTGCGIGAMKAPMKGAAVGHAKQQIKDGRYIGISEPGIISSESPNAIVNELIIMPDIEKRLEAFVRLAHSIIVFPGGVGTVEEILYLLGIVMHPDNNEAIPLIFAGPETCAEYFQELVQFLKDCLGDDVENYFQVFLGSPHEVGRNVRAAVEEVHERRSTANQAYYFNWELNIPPSLQEPFIPTHENMAALNLSASEPKHELASSLRSAFSGIVAGNVKEFGIEQVQTHGPYKLTGNKDFMSSIDRLLRSMARDGRMKLGEGEYQPCYQLID